MLAPTLMIQGTASSVGKSILTTALCRMFANDGLRVLPFKSQNMALNAFVTPEGGEIGRAQAVQAEACRVPPHVDMNPILLKPEGDARSQVVVLGKAMGSLGAVDYHAYKPQLKGVIAGCLERLRSQCDLVVIEGAGSPAEINLRPRDIVNMHVAHAADARVLLAGDIDRGGVFAALVGTMELLEPEDRARIVGFVINKFRGDVALLQSGLDFLEARTGVPTLGVIPHVPALRIADEDSVSLDRRDRRRRGGALEIDIAVVRLPRISNYDDFAPLEHEPGVAVRFIDDAREVDSADLVIVPGSKSTVSDLAWLRRNRIAEALAGRASRGAPILAVCGGCQMLGGAIDDPGGIESSETRVHGLGVLPITTRFGPEKRTAQVRARGARATFLAEAGAAVTGYEIHMGRVSRDPGAPASFVVQARNGAVDDDLDGAVNASGTVVGTMLHGIFEGAEVRARLLAYLRDLRGIVPAPSDAPARPPVDEYDRIADVVRQHLDVPRVRALLGIAPVQF